MVERYYKEDYTNEYVEVENYGVIKLSSLPITLNEEKCHYIDWVRMMNGEGAGKHVLSEVGGCSSMNYGGCALRVIRIIGVDLVNE